MKTVHFEDTVRRGARRVRGSLSHLIDDGQDVVGSKLAEAKKHDVEVLTEDEWLKLIGE